MHVPADSTAVVNRLKRAQGQLAGVLKMIEDERELEAIVTQLKAVSKAIDRAGFAIIAGELNHAVNNGGASDEHLADLEKFFLTLS